ncbi:hypothetical protein D9M68_992620 [compost metagenome]
MVGLNENEFSILDAWVHAVSHHLESIGVGVRTDYVDVPISVAGGVIEGIKVAISAKHGFTYNRHWRWLPVFCCLALFSRALGGLVDSGVEERGVGKGWWV